jgi:hypothetical protein
VVKLKPGVAIGTILSRYNAALLGIVPESRLYFLQLPAGQTAEQVLPALNVDPDRSMQNLITMQMGHQAVESSCFARTWRHSPR